MENHQRLKILFKYATRGRPVLFLKTLQRYLYYLSWKNIYEFSIAMDNDDETMNNDLMRSCIEQFSDMYEYRAIVGYTYGEHTGTVHAINTGLAEKDFDIVMAISDDYIPMETSYDVAMCDGMLDNFPKMDGAIYFNDGECGAKFAINPIMGRKLYDERGYFFNPDYLQGSADRELTSVLRLKNKMVYYPQVRFMHIHKHHLKDETYNRAIPRCKVDRALYRQRAKAGCFKSGENDAKTSS